MKIRRKFLKLGVVFLFATLITSGLSKVAYADAPYRTYTVDGYGQFQETQTAYLAKKTLFKFGNEFFKNPSDMFVAKDGKIYVADTGHKRIVVGSSDGRFIKNIGEGILAAPKGVYVTKNNHVYVADHDAGAIFEFDGQGKLIHKYSKPTSPLYGAALKFMPSKIVVNKAGIMFAVCESNTNGIVEISPAEGGTFLGYFGTNFASTNLQNIIYRAILTDKQRAKMISNIPATPDNLAVDKKGLIYTVTRGEKNNTLKKLNIAGINMLRSGSDYYDLAPAAVTVGNHDNIYVASQEGYIYEYSSEGNLLYVFGGADDGTQRVGLSTLVTSIQVDKQDNIYVLDSDKNQIQVYQPSEFTSLLHKALYLYYNGRYAESEKSLSEVLKMNSLFNYANKAMGRAYYQKGNYSKALKYAKIAKDYQGYSDTFWELRNAWLKHNIVISIFVIVGLWVLFKVMKFLDKKKQILNRPRSYIEKLKTKKVISNLSYAKYFMKHPIDGSYGIAREGRASWSAPSILLAIFMLEYTINKYLCGFLQKTVMEGQFDIFSDVGMIIVVIVAITSCNYLVCTINDGEGTVKKIYTYFCYCLMPYIMLTPVSFALSHILTYNEQFLITLVNFIMVCWVLVLAILGIKEVNNYTAKETVKVICLTLFTILIISLLIFIIYVLWSQVFQFIRAIFGEVVYRLGY